MLNLFYRAIWIILLLVGTSLYVQAQNLALPPEDIDRYHDELRSMVSFYQFTLNTLGDPLATAAQKETIVNESYSKIFRDDKVQIEDDLIAGRTTVVNKDVQAYLKDISFFYRSVRFQWLVEEITQERNDAGDIFFRIAGTRTLKGLTLEGDSVENNIPRFIEVNLNEELDQLKIVSVYTTRENETAFLIGWWEGLSPAWQQIFADQITVRDSLNLTAVRKHFPQANLGDTLVARREEKAWADDSLTLRLLEAIRPGLQIGDTVMISRMDTTIVGGPLVLQSLRKVIRTESLDLTGHTEITSLEPLSQLTGLKSLNVQETSVRNLFPIRNLIYLRSLNLRGTSVRLLEPLKFLTRLQHLDISQTEVEQLSPLSELPGLVQLNIGQTPITDLSPLSKATELTQLYLRQTPVKNLDPIKELPKLQRLDASATQITTLKALQNLPSLKALYINRTQLADLAPLGKLPALSLLFCEHTPVANLDPLIELPQLRRIYCDSSKVQAAHARSFMARKAGTLVVYGSMALRSWWSSLDTVWQDIFREKFNIRMLPKREQLHQIAGLNALDLSGQSGIQTLEPLGMLSQLQDLSLKGTAIATLAGVEEMLSLQTLDFSETKVKELSPLQELKGLTKLRFNGTQIKDLMPLKGHSQLESIHMEGTLVQELMPLKTAAGLREIWADSSKLTAPVVHAFLDSLDQPCLVVYRTPSLEKWWNSLNDAWKSVFRNHASSDNEPSAAALHQMADLKQIKISGRPLNTLEPLRICRRLEVLICEQANIQSVSPLAALVRLHTLGLGENPLGGDLSLLGNLVSLEELDLHNSPVQNLEFVSELPKLERLNFSGTPIKKLDDLEGLLRLAVLDISITAVKNLSPLESLPELSQLICFNTRLKAKNVDKLRSIRPNLEIVFY